MTSKQNTTQGGIVYMYMSFNLKVPFSCHLSTVIKLQYQAFIQLGDNFGRNKFTKRVMCRPSKVIARTDATRAIIFIKVFWHYVNNFNFQLCIRLPLNISLKREICITL